MAPYQLCSSHSSLTSRHAWRAVLASSFAAVISLSGVAAIPASAATVCNADTCVVVPDTLQTPLGVATVDVSPTKVVTVTFVPSATGTLVLGSPFTLPPVAGCPGGCAKGCPGGCTRTSIALVTTAGVVNIDTITIPPGPPNRFAVPSLAIISLMIPPGPPCRVQTLGDTVVFTPAPAHVG
jgi:hypothetical protein